MENLWAPWRMRYIENSEEENGCIFCEKPGEENDRNNLILYRGEYGFIIMNKYPYNNGHLLIVPYRHTNAFDSLDEKEVLCLHKLLKLGHKALTEALNPHGFNVGLNLGRTAGAGIDQHLHYHIVPRWDGDTNFMPVIGKVKVISQAMEETYDRLFNILNGKK